jgi:RNA polymerase sigma-B factor
VTLSTSAVSPLPRVSREDRRVRTEELFARRAEADDPAERARLEEELVRLNLRMASDATRRFRDRGVPDEDVEQVAFLGLVKAVQAFDPARGHDFLSFAVPTIRGEVRRYFRDHGWAVRPTRPVQEAQSKIIGCEAELYQELGRAPRPTEIAAHLGLELDLVVEALGANGCFSPVSLDAPMHGDEDDMTVGARLSYTEEEYDVAEARVMLEPLLSKLSKRDRLIVEMRFVRGLTQAEIGAEIGVTQMQVSRLLARILKRLRDELKPAAA